MSDAVWSVFLDFKVPLCIGVSGARDSREASEAIRPKNYREALLAAIAGMDDDEIQELANGGKLAVVPDAHAEDVQ